MLTIELSDEKIDYAEEMGSIIVHFTEKGKPEFSRQDSNEFTAEISKIR